MWVTIGIVACLITILIAIRALFLRRIKKLKYALTSNTLIDKEAEDYNNLKVLYNDKLIAGFTSTKIVIWNAGRSPIRSDDIPKGSPLALRSDNNVEILEYEVFESNDQ